MQCKFCGTLIYGGKGDYWHVGTEQMRCNWSTSLAQPMDVDAAQPTKDEEDVAFEDIISPSPGT